MANPILSKLDTNWTISPATRLGHVHYTVADLDAQIAFYQNVLGFKLHWRDGDSAGLGGGGEDLLRLTEVPGAQRVRGTTGLYHTAFLVPTRWELAQLLKRIAQTRTPIQGMSDHGTHHAIYLPDAEGNGIELAWDFPQEKWPKTFEEMMRRNRGLSPEEVFRALNDSSAAWDGLDAATKVGHVHLHVADLDATRTFYHDVLGFGLPFEIAMDTAVFFSAGGYHHHIGTNVWQGVGAPPPPPDAIGLRYFTVILPDGETLQQVVERVRQAGIAMTETDHGVLLHDPAQNGVLLADHAPAR
jgi:catechol 2,3-dioxygenase